MIQELKNPEFLHQSFCCPHITFKEAFTWWLRPKQGNGLIPAETLDLALKWFETRFKLMGFNYKINKKTNFITLFQVVFTHGVKGPIMKAKNETEDNIQTAFLKDD